MAKPSALSRNHKRNLPRCWALRAEPSTIRQTMITAEQCRAARALLDWSREQLAETSRVSRRTIIDFERSAREPRYLTFYAIRRVLEEAGESSSPRTAAVPA